MARTDKDRPYWVRADDPLEDRYEDHDHRGNRECDLHESAKGKLNRYTNCGYWLNVRPYSGGPPDWFRRARWHGPERRRERNELGELAKRFRGGELEDLGFASFQHRHSALWDWF